MNTADVGKIFGLIILGFSLSLAGSKSQSAQRDEPIPVATYFSPDGSFSLETFRSSPGTPVNQVDFVDKATGRRTRIDLGYALQHEPVISDDSTGFVLFEGTSSMGSWPLFYKRESAGGIIKIGPSLSDDGSPGKLMDNIMRLIPKRIKVNRIWISVEKWDGGPRAEIEVSASTGHGTWPLSLILDISRDFVSKRTH